MIYPCEIIMYNENYYIPVTCTHIIKYNLRKKMVDYRKIVL